MAFVRLFQTFFLAVCIALSVSAEAVSPPPVFEALTGWFGTTRAGAADCASNPRYQSFSQDLGRILFHWARPHQSSYLGKMITNNGGTVVDNDEMSVTHIRDFEPEFDSTGEPIRWTYHVQTASEGFCVSRSDWPETGCYIHYIRCTSEVTTS